MRILQKKKISTSTFNRKREFKWEWHHHFEKFLINHCENHKLKKLTYSLECQMGKKVWNHHQLVIWLLEGFLIGPIRHCCLPFVYRVSSSLSGSMVESRLRDSFSNHFQNIAFDICSSVFTLLFIYFLDATFSDATFFRFSRNLGSPRRSRTAI